VAPGTPAYTNAVNPCTSVIACFSGANWGKDQEGWTVMHCFLRVDHDMYFRVRGTNNPMNSTEIDPASPNGDPALDVPATSTPEKAWADLWFYSNPIFVDVSSR
jgi:hypothetical protein